jgi:hypothetical protein
LRWLSRTCIDLSSALLGAAPDGLRCYAEARLVRQRLANLGTELAVWANDGFAVQDPAERASRQEHIRSDDVLAALRGSIWNGYAAVRQDLEASEVAARLGAFG